MIRKFIRRLLRARGLQLLKIPSLGDFIHDRGCDLVIDVGANVGQFGESLRELGYRGKILSFEPINSCFATLVEKSKRDGNWECVNEALGSKPHAAEINVSVHTAYSSILPLSNVGIEFDPNTAIVEKQKIIVNTIDDYLSGKEFKNIFLKIDTQGFEKEVLAGAVNTLGRCSGLLLELPVENLYEGVWGFTEALKHVEGLGFVPAQITPVSPRRFDKVSALEFDCVFRRVD
ncbi:MAG: FkbM family methyltransferase [Proteobacteria bacterium]|nr:FkbM family methyltransferase [Pseudomonadota bacterium]